jgi:GH25 family lysozyme M1 (1,4-beta-N-acetylmuramidase)
MTPYIFGIDVSDEQGVIDWTKVAGAGVKFAILKCGNGNAGVDRQYATNLTEAKAHGIACGAYQFIFPIGLASTEQNPNRAPEEQAKLHWNYSKGLGCAAGDIQTFIDAEWPEGAADWTKYGCSKAQIQDWLARYKQTYEAESGCLMGIYTDEYWWEQIDGAALSGLSATPFWVADPQPTSALPVAPAAPKVYAPFSSYSIWQHTWKLVVPGVVDFVDGDCIPDANTFAALTTRP